MSNIKKIVKGTYIASVHKALLILEMLSENEESLSLTEISARLGFNVSTTHHIIATLLAHNFLEQNPDTKEYSIGLKLFEISFSSKYHSILKREAEFYLKKLSEATNECANLALLVGGEITYLAQSQSSRMMQTFVQLGKRSPVHCTGVGKVLISEHSPEDIKQILDTHGMEKYTRNTITSFPAFIEELEKVRKLGYAFDDEEREEGVICIAAPARNFSGKIVAALSVSGPTSRLKVRELTNIIELIKETCDCYSESLGWKRTGTDVSKDIIST